MRTRESLLFGELVVRIPAAVYEPDLAIAPALAPSAPCSKPHADAVATSTSGLPFELGRGVMPSRISRLSAAWAAERSTPAS